MRDALERLLGALTCIAFASGLAATPLTAFAGTVVYTYDSLGRVASATYANGTVVQYTYDATGNRTVYSVGCSSCAPVASAVTASIAYGSGANTIALNITGGAPTGVSLYGSAPAHGSASASGTSITYTPTTNYAGSDTFQYKASNTYGVSAAATITLTVSALPVVAGPVTAGVAPNSTANAIALNVTGGTATSVAVTTQAIHGSASAAGATISYTPTSGYSGPDAFWYSAVNAVGTSAPAKVSISVTQPPVANAVSASVAENTSGANIALNVTGGPPTAVAVSTGAAHGMATASGTSISYTPSAGYIGADTFAYTATNLMGTSAPAAASITVVAPPFAGAVTANVPSNATNAPIALSLSGGTATSVALYALPIYGTATASGTSITYTPAPSNPGSDSFTYTATNVGGTSAPATVTLNIAPLALANAVSATVSPNSTNNPISLSITGATATSVAVSTAALHGTATASGTSISYTPTSGYVGTDSFQYTATNAIGTSPPATASITVSNDGVVLYSKYVSGSFSYTVPSGVVYVDIEGWGGGGNGQALDLGDLGFYWLGGGGGGYFKKHIAVTTGQTISGSVAAADVTGSTTVTSPSVSATSGGTSTEAGGTASGGDVNTAGEAGGPDFGGSAGNGGGEQTDMTSGGTTPGGGGYGYGAGASGAIKITARTS